MGLYIYIYRQADELFDRYLPGLHLFTVYDKALVSVYEAGFPGFWRYVLLYDTVVFVESFNIKIQQTPNLKQRCV